MSDIALWEASAEAWLATVEQDKNRTLLLDPIMLELAGDVGGLRCLDIGCGEGRFMRMLQSRGAEVSGIDPVPQFAERAAAVVGSGDALPFQSEAFDLVISYMSHCDIADSRRALQEWVRVLAPGGRLLIADIHPMCSIPYWVKDEHGNKLHRTVDQYFEERGIPAEWSGIKVVNYHRPMSQTIYTLLSEGLTLEHFIEPSPSDEAIAAAPNLADHRRVPNFWITAWRRPTE